MKKRISFSIKLKFFIFLISMGILFLYGQKIRVFAEPTTKEKKLTILIDPGHGESGSGASEVYQGVEIAEETLNLKIAQYLREELAKYENVNVYMTREEEYNVDLDERTQMGIELGADILISIHNNAYGPNAEYDHGSTVLVSRGQYKEEIAQLEQELGTSILYELSCLGLENQGLLVRDSCDGETYENGSKADYYRIIKNGILNDLPSVIIEHAFLDNELDYENYLSSEEKLQQLAKADCRGIARYYSLKKSNEEESFSSISNIKQKILYMKDDNYLHNETYEKIFFEKEMEATTEESTTEKNIEKDVKKTHMPQKSLAEEIVQFFLSFLKKRI